MGKDNEDFKDLNVLNKILVIIVISLLILLPLGAVFGIIFLGFAGLFEIMGVEYDSIGSLFIYVISYFLISLVLELFVEPFSKIMSERMEKEYQVFLTRMVIESSFTWLILHTIGVFMSSISVSVWTEVIVAILLFLVEYFFGDNKKEETEIE